MPKSKLLLACPMYDGRCHSEYHGSVLRLARLLEFDEYNVKGCCFVDVARNQIAEVFLKGDWTHLLMIDSDIGFETAGVLKILAYANDPEYPIIGAACPKRQLNLKKVKESVEAGESEDMLLYRGCDWNYNIREAATFDTRFPILVDEIGAGIMAVRREVFESMTTPYFESPYINGEKIGEDIMFCRRFRESGGKVWMAPWVLTKHMGVMAYPGDMTKANLNY
jgi:hypothetical protein